mmetsp:Transcript_34711/g.40917  ORF Transcript_34711/g.40917 Transcript_34711/m.40917 type:complete len:148 (-) Transcript_34711:220-663(-)
MMNDALLSLREVHAAAHEPQSLHQIKGKEILSVKPYLSVNLFDRNIHHLTFLCDIILTYCFRRGDVQVRGSVGGAVSESSSGDLSDDGSGSPSEGSHSQSGDVSLASSASGSGIDDDEDGSGSEISGSADFEGDDYRSEGEDSEDNF